MTAEFFADAGVRALFALVSSGLLAAAGYYLRPKASIIYSALHEFRHVLPPRPEDAQAPRNQPADSGDRVPEEPKSGTRESGPIVTAEQAPRMPLVVSTQTLFVQNIGRGCANEVEVFLNFKPMHYSVWPVRAYSEQSNPDGRHVIKVPKLNRNEWFTIELIAVPELPWVMSVRSEAGFGKQVELLRTRKLPQWVLFLLISLMFLGLVTIVFSVISIISLLT